MTELRDKPRKIVEILLPAEYSNDYILDIVYALNDLHYDVRFVNRSYPYVSVGTPSPGLVSPIPPKYPTVTYNTVNTNSTPNPVYGAEGIKRRLDGPIV